MYEITRLRNLTFFLTLYSEFQGGTGTEEFREQQRVPHPPHHSQLGAFLGQDLSLFPQKRAKSCRNQPKETKPREDRALPQPEKLFLHLWCSLVSAVRCTFRVFPCPTCFWGGFVTLFASSFSVWGEGEMEKGILFQNPEFGQLCLKMEVSIKPISEGLKEEIFKK